MAEAAGNGNLKLSFGHCISSHWSAEAGVSFRIWPSKSGSSIFPLESREEYEMKFRFWCREYGDGPSISLGGACGRSSEADIRIGTGYSMNVWKHLYIDIGYGIRLFKSLNGQKPGAEELTIELIYRFQL